MDLALSLLTLLLMAAGVVGTILPFLPGTTLILVMAMLHRFVFVPEKSIGWYGLGLLVALYAASVALDWLSSAAGARRFGASRLAMIGSVVGAFVGIFFGLIGILVGPLAGALIGEIVARKGVHTAVPVGYGTLLGTLLGIVGRMGVAIVMVAVFFVAAWKGW